MKSMVGGYPLRRRGKQRHVVAASLALAVTACIGFTAGAYWDGQGSKQLPYGQAIDETRDHSAPEGRRINAAGQVIHRIRDGIYELRTQRDDVANPERLRDSCGKWLGHISGMVTEPIPETWEGR